MTWGYSSAGRAPALHAGGQRFDPASLHTIRKDRNSTFENWILYHKFKPKIYRELEKSNEKEFFNKKQRDHNG